MKNYGKILKEYRQQANITQTQLAKFTSITHATISYWENNKRIPTIENIETVADFYEISIDELVGHEVKEKWKGN